MVELIRSTGALILPTIFIFSFFLLINKWKIWKSKSKSMKKKVVLPLPPGPKKLPIIGNLHQLSNPPFRCFRDLSKQYGPLMHLKLGEPEVIVVSSPEMAKLMLKDLDPSFAYRPASVAVEIMWYNYSSMGFCPYGDYWRQMRKLCINELLSPKMVRLFDSIRRDEAARFIHSLHESSGSSINFTGKIFSFSSSITCRAAFGGVVSRDSIQTLIKLMTDMMRLAGGFEIADLFPSLGALSPTKWRLKTMRRKLDVILDDVIHRHKQNQNNSEFGGEDLVDVLLRAKEEDQLQIPIANHNIKAVLYDIFSAGTETSSTTIDWTMVELMRHPQIMAKVQAEVRQAMKGYTNTTTQQNNRAYNFKYLKLVIKETLRLHPPAPLLPRACNEEHVINGYTIPAGAKVLVNAWAMQRDSRYWNDPDKFEPERFENQALDFLGADFQFLPFGSGKRMCPGMIFGLANVESALAQLLYNFDWKLPEGVRPEDLDMIESVGLSATRKQNLFVVVTPYDEHAN